MLDKMWRWWPAFEKSGQRVRLALAGLVFLMALLSVVFTLLPVGSAALPAEGRAPVRDAWNSVQDALQPHLSLRYRGGQPPS